MSETSGTRTGRHAGRDLYAFSGASIPSAGNDGTLALGSVNSVDSYTLFRNSETAFQLDPTKGMTVACWINFAYLPMTGTGVVFACKKDGVTTVREWSLFSTGVAPNQLIRFQVADGGTFHAGGAVNAFWTPQPSANQWYFIVGRYDHTVPQVEIMVNNTSQGITAVSVTPSATSSPMYAVADPRLPITQSLGGRMQRLGVWLRPLSNLELAHLYNGGRGRDYPFN